MTEQVAQPLTIASTECPTAASARFKQLVLVSKSMRSSAAVTGRLTSSGITSIGRTSSCSGRVTIGASHVMSARRRRRQRRMRLIECPTVTNTFSIRSSKSSYYVVRPTILSECCSGRCWGSEIAAAGETTRARSSLVARCIARHVDDKIKLYQVHLFAPSSMQ